MKKLIAITRDVSRSIVNCELTHLSRSPIDIERARSQHRQYCAALQNAGAQVVHLPEEPALPDAVFVEDTVIVLEEIAVLTRPGAESRRPEVQSTARALRPYRPLLQITAPATLDGGDVLVIGKQIFVGLTNRSNAAAVSQLNNFLNPVGYTVTGVPVTDCLHLKSGITQVAEDTLLINPDWVDKSCFAGFNFIEVDPSEQFAANALWIGNVIIYPSAYTRTGARLETVGKQIILVDADELAKAEGGVTCCSLIFTK